MDPATMAAMAAAGSQIISSKKGPQQTPQAPPIMPGMQTQTASLAPMTDVPAFKPTQMGGGPGQMGGMDIMAILKMLQGGNTGGMGGM